MTNTYNVTNTNDTGSGSLREAVSLANSSPGLDTIFLQSDVELESSISIEDSLEIGTPYGAKITQNGSDRIFTIDDDNFESELDITLSNLQLSGGNTDNVGGAIYSAEHLELYEVNISDSFAADAGAIYQYGASLNISKSNILDNSADSGSASAIHLTTTDFEIDSSVIQNNESTTGSEIFIDNSAGTFYTSTVSDESLDNSLSLVDSSATFYDTFIAGNVITEDSQVAFGTTYLPTENVEPVEDNLELGTADSFSEDTSSFDLVEASPLDGSTQNPFCNTFAAEQS